MKKLLKSFAAVALSLIIAASVVTIAFADSEASLNLCVMSDIHYFPKSYIGDVNGYNFRTTVDNDRKLVMYSDEIVDSAIVNIIAQSPEYVIIPGDLVMSCQKEGHILLAEKLRILESHGIDVYVIPGNHDVSVETTSVKFVADDPDAKITVGNTEYVDDKEVEAPATTYDDFKSIYADFGYGTDSKIIARDESTLSYVAQLNDSYRLIAIDANYYENGYALKGKGLDEARLDWVLEQINNCVRDGDIPVAMMHYNIIEKYPGQSVIMSNNYLDDMDKISQKLADAGLHYIFTGHSHANDITELTTFKGNTIYEICTGALLLHGSPFRTIRFSGTDAEIRTVFIPSISGIDDFQSFSQNYFYNDGVRIMLRNRLIIDAGVAIAGFLTSDKLTYDDAFEFSTGLMQRIVDGLLDIELAYGITVCDVLTQAYKQHYSGHEVYSDEMRAAIAEIRNGAAFEKALNILFESIGKQTGISDKLEAILPNYKDVLDNFIADVLRKNVSNILGSLGGEFLDGIFTDTVIANDNDADLSVSDGTQTPFVRFLSIFKAIFRMIYYIIIP